MHAFKSMLSGVVLAACGTQTGCAYLDVRLASFMSPDRGIRTAQLPAGYVVENQMIARGGQSIGITYAHRAGNQAVILYCGGDAFHRSLEGGVVLQALALEADVVLFDYPGYGDTAGAPSTESILQTAATVYDHIFSLPAAAGQKRVVYGFSLGGVVAAHLARDRRVDGLALESTPPDVSSWARSRVPLALKPVVRVRIEPQLTAIDSVAALRDYRGKALLLVSRADEMVPARLSFEMQRRLQLAHRDVTLVEFADCRHGSIPGSPAFAAALRNFLVHVRPLA